MLDAKAWDALERRVSSRVEEPGRWLLARGGGRVAGVGCLSARPPAGVVVVGGVVASGEVPLQFTQSGEGTGDERDAAGSGPGGGAVAVQRHCPALVSLRPSGWCPQMVLDDRAGRRRPSARCGGLEVRRCRLAPWERAPPAAAAPALHAARIRCGDPTRQRRRPLHPRPLGHHRIGLRRRQHRRRAHLLERQLPLRHHRPHHRQPRQPARRPMPRTSSPVARRTPARAATHAPTDRAPSSDTIRSRAPTSQITANRCACAAAITPAYWSNTNPTASSDRPDRPPGGSSAPPRSTPTGYEHTFVTATPTTRNLTPS